MNSEQLVSNICRQFGGMDIEALTAIFCPVRIPIYKLVKNVFLAPGQQHFRASFQIQITEDVQELMAEGRTGVFVLADYVKGEAAKKEIAKGRLISIDKEQGIAYGEIFSTNTSKEDLEAALELLTEEHYFEIDSFNMAEKITEPLIEYQLERIAKEKGFHVTRIPKNRVKAADSADDYTFDLEKDGIVKRVQVKSLWGDDPKYARLIHPKSNRYLTSNCKFDAQDLFAVSLYARTGNTTDFAFAKSISVTEDEVHGLPQAPGFVGFVTQNPLCEIDNTVWFDDLDKAWEIL